MPTAGEALAAALAPQWPVVPGTDPSLAGGAPALPARAPETHVCRALAQHNGQHSDHIETRRRSPEALACGVRPSSIPTQPSAHAPRPAPRPGAAVEQEDSACGRLRWNQPTGTPPQAIRIGSGPAPRRRPPPTQGLSAAHHSRTRSAAPTGSPSARSPWQRKESPWFYTMVNSLSI